MDDSGLAHRPSSLRRLGSPPARRHHRAHDGGWRLRRTLSVAALQLPANVVAELDSPWQISQAMTSTVAAGVGIFPKPPHPGGVREGAFRRSSQRALWFPGGLVSVNAMS